MLDMRQTMPDRPTAAADAAADPAQAPAPGPTGAPAAASGRPRSRRRVCLIIDRIAGRSGGAERILIETANALTARGHEVQILTHEMRGIPPFYPLAPGVIHTNLRRPKAVRNRLRRKLDGLRDRLHARLGTLPFPLDHLLWASKYEAFRQRLGAYLAAHEPDVAIAFLPPAITALGRARPSPGLRRIASLHNVPEQDLKNPARWDPSPLDRRRRWEALAACDAVTVLLPEFRDWFPDALRARVSVLPNPVPQVPARLIGAARRQETVVSVGRLAPVKCHDVLIDAWARVAGDFPDWRLEIFGVGPSESALAGRIAEAGLEARVRLMGHTDAIRAEYLSASILCHPAAYEGWGLAVTEALAAGLVPVGFADCPGVNQLIRDGETGVLVSPGTTGREGRVAALAEALSGLMADPDRRARLGAAGPDSMRAYAPERITDLWEDILYPERPPERPPERRA
jgi:glycosyltransferase involved in cell wall biosynthesis